MTRTGAWVLLFSVLMTNKAWAAPPVLTWVFPAGGMRGSTVQAELGGTFPDWPPTIWSNSKDVSITPGKKSRLNFQIPSDALPGPRLFRLFNKDGASDFKCFWVGHIPELEEKEPNDNFLKPQLVGPGPIVVNGKLGSPGDADTFAMDAKKGQTIVARVQANQGLESPMDGVLQILSPEGFILAENHDRFGLDPFVQFTAPIDGVYRVRIFAFSATPDTNIRLAGTEAFIYRLTMTTGPYLDHPLPLAVSPGKDNTLRFTGWNLPKEFTPVKIHPRENSDAFMVHMKDVAGFFPNPTTSLPIVVNTGDSKKTIIDGEVSISGCLDVQKKHLFELKLAKGSKYRVKVYARRIGSDLDPVLLLRDEKGNETKRADDEEGGRDVSLDINPVSDISFLELFDLHLHSGERYYYRLDLILVKPDFEVSVEGDSFSSKDSKPVEIPIKVVRIGGFNQEIQIQAKGLPNGWSVEKLIVGPKTTNPTKLILKPSDKSDSGFFSIEAKSDAIQRTTVRSIPGLDAKTDQFFLFMGNGGKK